MTCDAKTRDERARRFRDAALPCLDDAYTLAHFIMRNQVDAEDAVQECYLRALCHFDGFRGTAVKPWLLAILKNVCYAQLARRRRNESAVDLADCEHTEPLWQQPQATPDSVMLSRQDGAAIRQLVGALPPPFREVIVAREFNDMSYREIAEMAGVPIGTVMSRLARARAMLLAAWKAADSAAQRRPGTRRVGAREYAGATGSPYFPIEARPPEQRSSDPKVTNTPVRVLKHT
jgi:RNA polymerase sigma-70 factor (ECF subfamily)